jgi:hypothetical protein
MAGGSVAGTSASTDQVAKTAARVFGSPVRRPVVSPLTLGKGKKTALETSVSDYSLAAPHFAHGDFETRAEHIPFVEGVSKLVSPAGSSSLFTEQNEFDEGCSAVKSLAVRVRSLNVVFILIASFQHFVFNTRSISLTFEPDPRCPLFNRANHAGSS